MASNMLYVIPSPPFRLVVPPQSSLFFPKLKKKSLVLEESTKPNRLTNLCAFRQVKKVEDVVYDLSLRGLLPKEWDSAQKDGRDQNIAPASA